MISQPSIESTAWLAVEAREKTTSERGGADDWLDGPVEVTPDPNKSVRAQLRLLAL